MRGARGDARQRATLALGWLAAGALFAVIRFAPPPPPAAFGAPTGRLADDLPPLAVAPAPVAAERPDAPVRVVAPPPSRPAERRRPFERLRAFTSPLLAPRLTRERARPLDFPVLRGLTARARPGQAVQVRLTAYCLSGRTRRGTRVRPGVVAADLRIFPMARQLELFASGRYLGRFRVEDTGSGVRGAHIDIWTPDCADARRFGSRAGVATLVGRGAR